MCLGLCGLPMLTIKCTWSSDARNCPMLHVLQCHYSGICGLPTCLSWHRYSHGSWFFDFQYPAARGALSHRSSIFQPGQTSETSLPKRKWYLQDRYKHAKRGGLPCLKSLVRCQSAGGDYPYSRFLDYLGSFLSSTEWTAKGVHTFYRVQCHCDT